MGKRHEWGKEYQEIKGHIFPYYQRCKKCGTTRKIVYTRSCRKVGKSTRSNRV